MCKICWKGFTAIGRQKMCSNVCRKVNDRMWIELSILKRWWYDPNNKQIIKRKNELYEQQTKRL